MQRLLHVDSSLLFATVFWLASATHDVHAGDSQTRWVGSWAASQQLVDPSNALDPAELCDATLRQIVHLSLGGNEIRLRLSNRFGAEPLHVTAVHIARPESLSKIAPASDKPLTFSGSPDVTVPSHADYLSDPASFPVDALSDVAITLHVEVPPDEQTGHPGSRATSYVTHGDSASAPELPGAKAVEHWYFIAGIDVAASPEASSVVVLGDSITDGHGATTNGNDRWTDILAQRLQTQPSTRRIAVPQSGDRGEPSADRWFGTERIGAFRSGCDRTARGPLSDCSRRNQ